MSEQVYSTDVFTKDDSAHGLSVRVVTTLDWRSYGEPSATHNITGTSMSLSSADNFWTLNTNIDLTATKKLVVHLTQKLHPIELIQLLIRNLSFVKEHDFYYNNSNRDVNFPVRLLQGVPVSLPIFCFVALKTKKFEYVESAFFTWAMCKQMAIYGTVGEIRPALETTATYFNDMICVHPLMCELLKSNHIYIGRIVARAIYIFRRLFITFEDLTSEINSVVFTPWQINIFTTFWTTFKHICTNTSIHTQNVTNSAPKGKSEHGFYIVNGKYGIVSTAKDKLLILLILLFTQEHNIASPRSTLSGIPPQVSDFITACRKQRTLPCYHELTTCI